MNNIIEFKYKYTVVPNCYKYSYEEINILGRYIYTERKVKGLVVTRTAKSYANEIRAHKRAYKLGIMRSHSKDVDLEENLNKKLEIIYRILGI